MDRPAVVNYGEPLTLNCTASGGSDNMFQWSKDGSSLSVNNNILEISTITAIDGGSYECTVNNTAGISSATITVHGRTCISVNVLCTLCM